MIFSLLGLGLIALAIILFLVRRRSAAKQAASVNWPTCRGQITETKVHTFRDNKNNNNLNYMARVWYAYEIAGTSYTSERIAWGASPYNRVPTEAYATIGRYPVGSEVLVYYNPQKPGESVLEPAATGGLEILTWMWIGIGAIGAIFFVVGFFVN